MSNEITYFAKTHHRYQRKLFGIRQADRLLHFYILGKSGTGKTSLIETMLMDDIAAGRGACFIDPHSDSVQRIYAQIPAHRRKDVIYFNTPEPALQLKYNPFKRVSEERRSLVASGILEVFQKLYGDAWGVKLEHILRNAILTLLDQSQASIGDIPMLLLDRSFRRQAIQNVANPDVRLFWEREFTGYTKYDIMPVLNKVGGMLAHPVIKRILIENPEEVHLRKAIDERKIVLVNLSKGHIGEDAAQILGALFITAIGSAAFSRANIPEDTRVPFILYADEFHNFCTLSLVNAFSEWRKFRVGLVIAHQYLSQLDDDIRHAVFGNVGTFICFRVGAEDANIIAKEMFPVFKVEDVINLANYNIYLKLMIDGTPSKPFSATTVQGRTIRL